MQPKQYLLDIGGETAHYITLLNQSQVQCHEALQSAPEVRACQLVMLSDQSEILLGAVFRDDV